MVRAAAVIKPTRETKTPARGRRFVLHEELDPGSGMSASCTYSLHLFRVALAELVDAAALIGHLLLAGEERVRMARDFHLDERIFLAVFPLDLLVARHHRAGQEREIARDVLEDDRLIIRVRIGFHGLWLRLRAG